MSTLIPLKKDPRGHYYLWGYKNDEASLDWNDRWTVVSSNIPGQAKYILQDHGIPYLFCYTHDVALWQISQKFQDHINGRFLWGYYNIEGTLRARFETRSEANYYQEYRKTGYVKEIPLDSLSKL